MLKQYDFDRFQTLKRNIRYTWKLINKVTHDRQGFEHRSNIPSLSVNELITNDPKVIVSKFNDFFGKCRSNFSFSNSTNF